MTRTARGLLALLVGLALLGGTAGCGLGGSGQKTLTARFDRTVGVYVKSDVRILGVRVGEVTKIKPEGKSVRVDMVYDAKYKVPADAKAVVVAPSIVSDRYVQLTPAWTGGPLLADGAVLAPERTAVPLELDEVYSSLDKLNQALGPHGANKKGALSDLLSVGAKNLDGNGEALGSTLQGFSQAVETLNHQSDDLFGTVTNLQDFTTTIAHSDDTVRTFNRDLADVSSQLAGERTDLATAVKQLSVALGEVATFVHDNKQSLTTNVQGLAQVTSVLVKQKTALEEFLDTAPTALSNLQLAYNPSSGTLDTRDDSSGNIQASPGGVICNLLQEAGTSLPPVLGGLPLGDIAAQCYAAAGQTAPSGPPGAAPAPAAPSLPSSLPLPGPAVQAQPAPSDRSLAGLLLGTR